MCQKQPLRRPRKSVNVDDLSDELIVRLVDHARAAPSDHVTIDVWYQGGAMARVGAGETAFGNRSSPIFFGIARPTGKMRRMTRQT